MNKDKSFDEAMQSILLAYEKISQGCLEPTIWVQEGASSYIVPLSEAKKLNNNQPIYNGRIKLEGKK